MIKRHFRRSPAALFALAAILPCLSLASAAQPPDLSFRNGPALAAHYSGRVLRLLGDHGVALHPNLVSDLSESPFNLERDHDWFSRYSFDLAIDMDAEKAMHWRGVSIHFDVKQHSNLAGDVYDEVAQGYSNIDADSRTTLYEAWVMQNLWNDRLQIQVGKIDANTRFASVATAADFLNSSMDYSPTIMRFPTYPEPKGGIDASVRLPASFDVTLGGFRTAGGRIALAEVGKRWSAGSDGIAGKLAIGYWNLQQRQSIADEKEAEGSYGLYSVVEQRLWASEGKGNSRATRSLNAFLQIGTGNARENSFTNHLGFGMVLKAPFFHRRSDSIGTAFTRLQVAGYDDEHISGSAEFVTESYYKLAWSHNVFLVADAQYFVHPGAGPNRSPYLVLTPRLIVAF